MQIGIDYTSAVRQRAGIGRYTRELVSALLALDSQHSYVLFAATGGLPKGRWSSEIERLRPRHDDQLTHRAIPLSDDWLARVWHRLQLPIPVELMTGRVDVFYSPDFTLPPTRPNTHTLLTVHDLSFVRYPDAFVPALRQYLERVVPRSIDRADMVLADSANTRSDLVTLFGVPDEKVRVIKPGVGARFHPHRASKTAEPRHPNYPLPARLRQRYDIGDAPYVLSVGTVQPRKNYVRLIQAFSRAETSHRGSLQLLIAGGPGWLYEDVFREADRRDTVRLIGFVDDKDLPALYRGAALFAFPSVYEGFGLPVLEAMACGVPVICSSASSLPEVASDAALLVDPLDVEGWSAAMTQALENNELRTRMVERGLARAADFTWERAARQLSNLITSWEEG